MIQTKEKRVSKVTETKKKNNKYLGSEYFHSPLEGKEENNAN